jgi:hypothetical protein
LSVREPKTIRDIGRVFALDGITMRDTIVPFLAFLFLVTGAVLLYDGFSTSDLSQTAKLSYESTGVLNPLLPSNEVAGGRPDTNQLGLVSVRFFRMGRSLVGGAWGAAAPGGAPAAGAAAEMPASE